MKYVIIVLLALAVVVIAGCVNNEDKITSKTVQEPKETTTVQVNTKPVGCGDGKCVDSERCDYDKYETVCPEDCPISCPPKIIANKPECVGACVASGNSFDVTGDAKIKIRLENVGERATNTATTKFRCYEGETLVIHNDGETKYDVTFRDYFDSYVEEKEINSRITTSGSVVNYFLDFDFGDLTRNADLTCSISIDDGTIDLALRDSLNVNLRTA